MNTVPLNDQNRDAAARLCDESKDAWFWHTLEWKDYAQKMIPNDFVRDESFLVLDNDKPLAFVSAFLQKRNGMPIFSLGHVPIPYPFLKNDLGAGERKKLEAEIFQEISARAKAAGAGLIEVFESVLSESFLQAPHPITSKMTPMGYDVLAAETWIVDLRQTEDALWQDVRKGHKSAVKTARKACEVKIWKGDISDQDFQLYQDLHAEAAGRKTRSNETFDMFKEWIRQGKAVLVGARDEQEWKGFSFFMTYKKGAFYASACKKPGLPSHMPVGHLIIWEAMVFFKKNGYEFLELGRQFYKLVSPDHEDTKESLISRFKRGFGGRAWPRFESSARLEKEPS